MAERQRVPAYNKVAPRRRTDMADEEIDDVDES
jgi:hypothetical protein